MGASGQTVGPLVFQAPQTLADAGQVLCHCCDLSLGHAQVGLIDLELGLVVLGHFAWYASYPESSPGWLARLADYFVC